MRDSIQVGMTVNLYPVGKRGHSVPAFAGDTLNVYDKHAVLHPRDGRGPIKVQVPHRDVLDELIEADNGKS